MKLFVSLFFVALIALGVYLWTSRTVNQNTKRKSKKLSRKPIIFATSVTLVLLSFIIFLMYKSATAPDTQCTTTHTTALQSPTNPKTAIDYFLQGDYDYEIGNCQKAINDYTTSIRLDSNSPKSYNNRAYTYVRMQDYKDALLDLNTALSLNPNYIQALMNRGDIHNYYYQIDRAAAIMDYKKVISISFTTNNDTSVCGHLFLAEHNGWNLGTILAFPSQIFSACH